MGLLIPDAEDEVQVGIPGSTDENPTAEAADAILAAPSPSEASLLSIGLFLFLESNVPHVFSQNPRSLATSPPPFRASVRRVGPAPGTAQGRTIQRVQGRTALSYPLRNFNRFLRELLSPFTRVGSSLLRGAEYRLIPPKGIRGR